MADIARFCGRCHATLRYECPSCHHEQRQGGACEKCGVDFAKYLNMLLASNRDRSQKEHESLSRRSILLKDLLMVPFNMGIPLIRSLLGGRRAHDG